MDLLPIFQVNDSMPEVALYETSIDKNWPFQAFLNNVGEISSFLCLRLLAQAMQAKIFGQPENTLNYM